ncbi:hypothetical protein HDV00_006977 [Rhizophlyctis rosea]|nr:hypothetical protein HDV00_006977 [Rhizophlyctis rosea]
MVAEMKRVLETEGCPVEHLAGPLGQHSADIIKTGNSKIIYFFDTLDADMWKNDLLVKLITDYVTTLFIAGFFPTLTQPLLKLKELMHTELCSPYYPEHQKMWAFDHKGLKHTSVLDYHQLRVGGSNEFIVDCDHCGETITVGGV